MRQQCIRSIGISTFLLCWLLVVPTHANAGWTQLTPEEGTAEADWHASAMSQTGQVILVGHHSTGDSSGDLYLSTNGGSTWLKPDVTSSGDSSGAQGNWGAAAMSSDGQVLVISEDWGKVYVSTDAGSSWSQPNLGAVNQAWRSVAVSSDGTTMLAASDGNDGTFWLSQNTGTSWSQINPTGNQSFNNYWRRVATSSDGQTLFVIRYGTLYRSTDAGQTWTTLSIESDAYTYNNTAVSNLAINQDGQRVVLGQCESEGDSHTYLSNNSGDDWIQVGAFPEINGSECWHPTMSKSGQQSFVIGQWQENDETEYQYYFSDDYGASWQILTAPVNSLTELHRLSISGDGMKTLVAGNQFLWQYSIDTPNSESGATGGLEPEQPRSESWHCTNAAPTSVPDLFQIDVNSTQATVYFAPTNNSDRYYISYGDGQSTGMYGAEFITGPSQGVIAYTINYLKSGQQYSFVVRGGNGCMPGDWGNTMTVKTTRKTTGGVSYYRSFLHRVLSVFPRSVVYIEGQKYVLGADSESGLITTSQGCQPDVGRVRPDHSLARAALDRTAPFSSFSIVSLGTTHAFRALDATQSRLQQQPCESSMRWSVL